MDCSICTWAITISTTIFGDVEVGQFVAMLFMPANKKVF